MGSNVLRLLYQNRHFLTVILRSQSQGKHLLRWMQSLRANYQLDTPMPWLTFDAIEALRPRLRRGMDVFEFGSGGSTLFWLKLGARVVSVEHDPCWFNEIRTRCREWKIDYRLVLPDIADPRDGDPADPLAYVSSDERFASYNFRRYCQQIDEFKDRFFDLVLIDGRSRPSCIMHSVSKVREGGVLVLDNADREYYTLKAGRLLRGWTHSEYWGACPGVSFMTRTDLYTRPVGTVAASGDDNCVGPRPWDV